MRNQTFVSHQWTFRICHGRNLPLFKLSHRDSAKGKSKQALGLCSRIYKALFLHPGFRQGIRGTRFGTNVKKTNKQTHNTPPHRKQSKQDKHSPVPLWVTVQEMKLHGTGKIWKNKARAKEIFLKSYSELFNPTKLGLPEEGGRDRPTHDGQTIPSPQTAWCWRSRQLQAHSKSKNSYFVKRGRQKEVQSKWETLPCSHYNF